MVLNRQRLNRKTPLIYVYVHTITQSHIINNQRIETLFFDMTYALTITGRRKLSLKLQEE